MTLKIQMEFRMGGDGWSEILYADGTVAKDFQNTAVSLISERIKCLSNQALIHHCRVSVVGGATSSFRFPVVVGTGSWAARRDVGPTTCNVNCYTSNGLRRQIQLHGVPDVGKQYDADGVLIFTLDGKIDTYLTFLATANYQIRTVAVRAAAHTSPLVANK